jgi:hypothetical protein
MIHTLDQFRPSIKVDYPPNNLLIFETYFGLSIDEPGPIERDYLKIYWTAYHVNNDYGNNPIKRKFLQDFIDSLPRDKKYFTIVQYDDGCLVDFKDLDILIFNMSTEGFPIPLTCMDHPYTFDVKRDLLYSYVGSNTHPIRRELKQHTTKRLDIKDYCELHARSIFSLCPRGYGANSFRIKEALQYGAVPIYISDKFIEPFNIDFDTYGLKLTEDQIPMLEQILKGFTNDDIEKKREVGKFVYQKYYTYEGCRDEILKRI